MKISAAIYTFISSQLCKALVTFFLFLLPLFGYGQKDDIATVCSDDGRMEIFYQVTDPQGGIYHNYQVEALQMKHPNPGRPEKPKKGQRPSLAFMDNWEWEKWDRFLPVPDATSNVVASRDNGGRLIVCWISGGSIWYAAQDARNAGFASPVKMETENLRTLRLAKNRDGRIELFSISGSGEVTAIYQTDASAWTFNLLNMGHPGQGIIDIYPSPFQDGRLGLIALGSDRHIYWRSQHEPNGSWVDWSPLGGEDIQAVAAASINSGKLFVLAIGGDGGLWEKRQTLQSATNPNSWYEWRKIAAGPFKAPIKAGKNKDGRIEAVMLGANNVPVHTWQKSAATGSWTDTPAAFPSESNITSFGLGATLDARIMIAFCESYLSGNMHKAFATVQRQQAPNASWYITKSPPELFPTPPSPPSVKITDFSVKPDVGVYPGEDFQISWSFLKGGSSSPVAMTITKKYYQEVEIPMFNSTDASPSGNFGAPSGKSGFPKFMMKVWLRDMPGIADTKDVTRQVQAAQPTHVPAPFLVVVGPTHKPEILRQKMPFTISYTIVNGGDKEMDEFDVNLRIDGVKEADSKTVPKLMPGENNVITWQVTKELLGFIHSFELLRVDNGASFYLSQLTFENP